MSSMNGNRGTPLPTGMMNNGSLQQQQQQRRVNKTLGWYIGDMIEKGGDERDSTSPVIRPFAQPQAQLFQHHPHHHHQRKDSLGSESSHTSSIRNTAGSGSFSSTNDIEERPHRNVGTTRGRSSNNVVPPPPAVHPRRITSNQKAKPHHQPSSTTTPNITPNTTTNKENNSTDGMVSSGQRKENYWYFDPKTDGFYYESNGSRGWRKRNPKLHGSPMSLIQSAANASALSKAQGVIEAVAATQPQLPLPQQQSQLQPHSQQPMKQQTSKFFPNGVAALNVITNQQPPPPPPPQQPNIKYYDAASDGFFFEMASVDGWRRRQPAGIASAGAFPPGSLPNSYGGNTMVGHQQPMGQFHPQQPYQQRVFRPLQSTQMQHQQSKPFGSQPFGSQTTTFHQHMTPPVSMHQSVSSNCTCHHGSAPSTKVIQPPRSLRQQIIGGSGSGSGCVGGEFECPSSPSTAMSSSLSDASPPPPPQQGKTNQSMEVDSTGNGYQMSMITQLPHQQDQNMAIGSLDEPYEFYWSDTEKTFGGERAGSMASSMDDFGPAVGRDRENSLSEYFRELCGMGPTTTPNNGDHHRRQSSETPSGNNGGIAVKRPDTLRLPCSMNGGGKNGGGKNGGGVSNLPNFNVDQFIADLPNIVDHEKILKNLSALRTPMVESASRSFDPMLYTPIYAKEAAGGTWERAGYGQQQQMAVGKTNSGESNTATATADHSAGVSNLELNLKNINIEKIWQCPAF